MALGAVLLSHFPYDNVFSLSFEIWKWSYNSDTKHNLSILNLKVQSCTTWVRTYLTLTTQSFPHLLHLMSETVLIPKRPNAALWYRVWDHSVQTDSKYKVYLTPHMVPRPRDSAGNVLLSEYLNECVENEEKSISLYPTLHSQLHFVCKVSTE